MAKEADLFAFELQLIFVTMPLCLARSMRLARFLSCSSSVELKRKVSSGMPVTPLRSTNDESSCF